MKTSIKKSILIVKVFSILLLVSCKQAIIKKQKRPNILFIMSDDHAYQAISAYSKKLTTTPHIDRIANEGILFTNASVTNSICAPSRAVILTGKHSHINGKINNHIPFDTTNVTFPELFQKAGYQTAMFGKLHFGNNPKGFDEFKILPGQGDYYNPDFITSEGTINVEGYVTDIITDFTLEWLEKRRDTAKPFLLMYLHKAPHRTWMPSERHYKEFTKKTFPLPETLFDNHENMGKAAQTATMGIFKEMQLRYDNKITKKISDELKLPDYFDYEPLDRLNAEQRASWDATYKPISEAFKKEYPKMNDSILTVYKYQRYMQDYLACVASVDDNVGRVLNYLDENKLTENTIVVYTSDQGFYLGEHGWFDKRFIYEESFKTPLIIRWPNKIKPGITNDEMVQNLDFAQTFLEAAQIGIPDDMQGESLIPLLKSEKNKWNRDAVYYHFYEYPGASMVKRHYGIVTKEFKLIHFYYDNDEWELYDRLKDPQETNNVFNDPAYADTVKHLKNKLVALRTKYGDSRELDLKFIKN